MTQLHINYIPCEILSIILEKVTQAHARDSPTYTFGFSQAPLPFQRASLERYVRGFALPEQVKWDATSTIRSVCWKWHQWGLAYSLQDLHIRCWSSGERWAELPSQRKYYLLYELVDRPTDMTIYKDPLAFLVQTARLCDDYLDVASSIKRIWVHGFYTAATDQLIFNLLIKCSNLTSISVPWTTTRHVNARAWQAVLIGSRQPLASLEIQCIALTSQATDSNSRVCLEPLQAVSFSHLTRLKIFGDTNLLPITDLDLHAIARTATCLKEFHLTNNTSTTIDGVMAIVKASYKTLRVLEHRPSTQFSSKHRQSSEHCCEILRSCPNLKTLSVSIPSVCADLFSNEGVKFSNNLQLVARRHCTYKHGWSPQEEADALQKLLRQARRLIRQRAPSELHIELFLEDCIFEPGSLSVHGDFNSARLSSGGLWPQSACKSRGIVYGSLGTYYSSGEERFHCISEAEFLHGIRTGFFPVLV